MGKKMTCFLLLVIVIALCSCNNANSSVSGTNESQSEEIFSDTESELANLVITTGKEEYPADTKKIVYTIENVSQETSGFTEKFFLEKLTNGKWKTVSFKNKDTAFTLLTSVIEPGETREEEIDLEKYFKLPLKPGEYRISKEYWKSNKFIIL